MLKTAILIALVGKFCLIVQSCKKYLRILLFFYLGCSLGSNLLDENVPENFVMGGTNVAEGEFPWTVSY